MLKNMKLLIFITLGLFTLIYIGSKNEAFQPTITKLIVSFLFIALIRNIYIYINKKKTKK